MLTLDSSHRITLFRFVIILVTLILLGLDITYYTHLLHLIKTGTLPTTSPSTFQFQLHFGVSYGSDIFTCLYYTILITFYFSPKSKLFLRWRKRVSVGWHRRARLGASLVIVGLMIYDPLNGIKDAYQTVHQLKEFYKDTFRGLPDSGQAQQEFVNFSVTELFFCQVEFGAVTEEMVQEQRQQCLETLSRSLLAFLVAALVLGELWMGFKVGEFKEEEVQGGSGGGGRKQMRRKVLTKNPNVRPTRDATATAMPMAVGVVGVRAEGATTADATFAEEWEEERRVAVDEKRGQPNGEDEEEDSEEEEELDMLEVDGATVAQVPKVKPSLGGDLEKGSSGV